MLNQQQCADAQSTAEVRAFFHVLGDADPTFLPRIVGPLAKLGHTPERLHASAEDGDGSVMTIDLRMARATQATAKRIENALRTIVGVRQVIVVYEPC
jgi:hypothetical protein